MPTISLRLTDEQHAELKAWAHGAQRSLQRELIYRLFSASGEVIRSSAGFVTPQGREEAERVITGNTDLIDHLPTSAPRGVDPHFKPDFKGGK